MITLPLLEKPQQSMKQWRSLPQLHEDAAFAERMGEEVIPAADPPSRRQFMQVMGASMAMAGLVACRRPVQKVLPFARQPEDMIPGIPLHYATSMPFRGAARPILVKSSDGRPTKIEGNALHPASTGATSPFEQAALLSLYDPDRSRTILQRGQPAAWEDFTETCAQLGDGSRHLAVLAAPNSSVTLARLRAQLADRFAAVDWVTYRSEGDDTCTLGIQTAFGQPLRPVYDFSGAKVVVSLDADFLGPTSHNFAHAAQAFAQNRSVDAMGRLYVAESTYSITGGMADHRMRIRASDIGALAADLAGRLGAGPRSAGATASDVFIQTVADDLRQAGSKGIVLAGESQPAEVHALCAVINAHLGSIGDTVQLLDTGEEQQAAQHEAVSSLTERMRAGEIDAVMMLGVNPAYDAPTELDFAGALASVPLSVHVDMHRNETARLATWHIPATHFLEAWGDSRAYDGTLAIVQPLVAPLHENARSEIEVLAVLATRNTQNAYELVRDALRGVLPEPFEAGWRQALHDGFVDGTAYPSVAVTDATLPDVSLSADAGIEVVFRLDPTVLDGSFANNAWCQELPDPVTKIVWDNVAAMSPATAEVLGVRAKYSKGRYNADILTLSRSGRSIELPVWIVPGHADNSITVTLGYGREIDNVRPERRTPVWDTDDKTDIYARGALANGVGQNVAVLRDVAARAISTDIKVAPSGRDYRIVTTQDHGVLDIEARPLLRLGTLEEYRDNPHFALEEEAPTPGSDHKTDFQNYPALWENSHPADSPVMRDSNYYRNQWGMVIDLNTCTGCGTCVLACQAENNIQVVGKEEVGNGRELHWLRLDRYFVSRTGTDLTDDPEMVLQPVPCQHCENAPCEAVCPVAATVHSPDGTNQMIYNRCIGTRYCANNCPYKVRRFNYFNWAKTIPETVQMAQNPQVTVRSRGVMEKCSFCVQRIRSAQRTSRLEDRDLARNEVRTACQQACPTDAITFGDLNDRESDVSRQRRDPRAYTMLAELAVKPRVAYLARIRNPNASIS